MVDRMAAQLRHAGLRPTRQRIDLGRILFAKGHRHISRGGPACRGRRRRRARLARHRLQHAAPVHRRGPFARGRHRRRPHLFRHQHQRPPSFLRRGRGHADRPASARSTSTACPSRPPAWRSRRWKWWCGFAGCADPLSARSTASLLEFLVRVDAPQALLLDPALEARAAYQAPAARALLHVRQDARLQIGDDRGRGVRRAVRGELPRPSPRAPRWRSACRSGGCGTPSLPSRRNRGSCASSRTRR